MRYAFCDVHRSTCGTQFWTGFGADRIWGHPGTFYCLARPRGRCEGSGPSRRAVACVHFSDPYGRPRLVLSRTAMRSDSVCSSNVRSPNGKPKSLVTKCALTPDTMDVRSVSRSRAVARAIVRTTQSAAPVRAFRPWQLRRGRVRSGLVKHLSRGANALEVVAGPIHLPSA